MLNVLHEFLLEEIKKKCLSMSDYVSAIMCVYVCEKERDLNDGIRILSYRTKIVNLNNNRQQTFELRK